MPNAVHFICRREGTSRHGLTPIPSKTNCYRSCCWLLSDEQAASLEGGWVYFHETKKARSAIGGRILGFEQGTDDMADRKIVLLRLEHDGRGQVWRGRDHGMAMWSGVVAADLPHEAA